MSQQKFDVSALEEVMGYSFKEPELLIEALTHKSYHYENRKVSRAHNERLEFLGDSILGVAVASYLFRHRVRMDEAMMSKVKSYVVKGTVISEVALGISLGSYLLMGRGEIDTGGREKASILTNAMEAVIGAVYMDGGAEAARTLVLKFFKDRLETVVASGEFHDYKTEFQEVCQDRLGITPEYEMTAEDGKEHRKTFTIDVVVDGKVYGSGTGRSKKKAEQEAAKKGIIQLEEGVIDPFL